MMFGGAAAIQPMRHRQFAAQMSPQLTARLGRQSSFWNRRRHGTVPRAGTARRGGGLLQWLMGNESESSTSARKTVASRRLRSAGADGNVEPAKDLPIQVTSTESKMLALWDDHAYYTILVLLGLTTPLPDQQTAIFVTRLMQNQDNIGYLFVPRFGKDAANKVAGLLKVHIELAAKVIRANLPSTEGASSEKASEEWDKNATQIGEALYGLQQKTGRLFPTKQQWIDTMIKHLRTLTAVVTAQIRKEFAEMAKSTEPYVAHVRHLAMDLAKLVSGPPVGLTTAFISPLGWPMGFVAARPTPSYTYAYRPIESSEIIPEYSPFPTTTTSNAPPYRLRTRTVYNFD